MDEAKRAIRAFEGRVGGRITNLRRAWNARAELSGGGPKAPGLLDLPKP